MRSVALAATYGHGETELDNVEFGLRSEHFAVSLSPAQLKMSPFPLTSLSNDPSPFQRYSISHSASCRYIVRLAVAPLDPTWHYSETGTSVLDELSRLEFQSKILFNHLQV